VEVDNIINKTLGDNDYFRIRIECVKIGDSYIPLLHVDIYKWSKSLYLQYLDVFENLQIELNKLGIDELYVYIAEGDKKLLKFTLMFGFEYDRLLGTDENTYILMSKEIK